MRQKREGTDEDDHDVRVEGEGDDGRCLGYELITDSDLSASSLASYCRNQDFTVEATENGWGLRKGNMGGVSRANRAPHRGRATRQRGGHSGVARRGDEGSISSRAPWRRGGPMRVTRRGDVAAARGRAPWRRSGRSGTLWWHGYGGGAADVPCGQ